MCVVVPDLEALQTSTDMSRRSVGSHSIEEAPGERGGFLTATWLSVVCSAKTPLAPLTPPPPSPEPPPKLQRSPYLLAALSAPSFLLSTPPPLVLPPLDADTASTAGVL